jgi:hypothetical protein
MNQPLSQTFRQSHRRNTNSMEQSPSSEAISPQLVTKFPAFYRTRRFIAVFTKTRRWTLSWARWIQSTPLYPISLRWILILSSHLYLVLPSSLFRSGFPTQILYVFKKKQSPTNCNLLDATDSLTLACKNLHPNPSWRLTTFGLEADSPSTAGGRTVPWWQDPVINKEFLAYVTQPLSHCTYFSTTNLASLMLHLHISSLYSNSTT